MQSVSLHSLIMGHRISGILHQIIMNNALVHKFHGLTSGLVVGTDLITIMTAI